MAILGNNIFLSLDGTNVIAGTRSNEIQSGCDILEISSASDSEWKHFIAGRKSWNVSVSWLLLTDASVANLLTVGTTVTAYIMSRSGGSSSTVYSGQAVITACKLTLNMGNIANGTLSLQGSGPLNGSSSSS